MCFTARRACIARTMPWQDVCLSVRLSVCLSVTRRYSVETAKHLKRFTSEGSQTILAFHTKRDGNVPTGTP